MKSYGKNISEEKIIEKILLTLTKKHDDIVIIIEETKDLSKIFSWTTYGIFRIPWTKKK